MSAAVERVLWPAGSVVVAAGIFALWWAVTAAGTVPPIFLPKPQDAFAALWDGLLHRDLFEQTMATVQRMLVGWVLASVAGILIGAFVGMSATARAYLGPTLELLRPLPASTLIPVGVALFGLQPGMLLAVIAAGAMWPVLLATVHGFSTIHPRLHEVARILMVSRFAFATKFGLPAALPDIIAGMRISLTACLIITVIGEIMTAQEGLGTSIILAQRSFRSTDLFAGIILLGLVGFVNNALLAVIERRFLRWRNQQTSNLR